MELLPVDSEERLARAQKVWDALEKRNQEIVADLRNMDNIPLLGNEDAWSDLSDPFSDMGDSELARPAKKVNISFCVCLPESNESLSHFIPTDEPVRIECIAHVKFCARIYESARGNAGIE